MMSKPLLLSTPNLAVCPFFSIFFFFFALSGANAFGADSYSIRTLAGSARIARDGKLSEAAFFNPSGLGIDAAGNIYVTEATGSIRIIRPDLSVNTLAGSLDTTGYVDGVGILAQFRNLRNIAVDPQGNVYVLDTDLAVVRKVTADGTVTTFVGKSGDRSYVDGPAAVARLGFARDIAADQNGNLYFGTFDGTIRKITPAGTVSTYAGVLNSFDTKDGPLLEAHFFLPDKLTISKNGTIFVLDSGKKTLRKISTAGIVSTVSANLPVDSIEIFDIAADSAGNVFLATFDNTILKVAPDGKGTLFAGKNKEFGFDDGIGAAARFASPSALLADAADNLYVADFGSIRKITPGGQVTTPIRRVGYSVIQDGVRDNAAFAAPSALAVNTGGEIFVAEDVFVIRKITTDQTVSTFTGTDFSKYVTPTPFRGNLRSDLRTGGGEQRIAFDGTGNLLSITIYGTEIEKISPQGVSRFIKTHGFKRMSGLALDSAGTIYIADQELHTISKITPAGKTVLLAGKARTAGSADGIGKAALFNFPGGLAVDAAGNVYVADIGNHTIRKITPAGVVTTVAGIAGLPGATDSSDGTPTFNAPFDLTLDAAGTIFVADTYNHAIRKIDAQGIVTTVAGLPGKQGTADGPGSNARFRYPSGVAVDKTTGILYISDTNNGTIRVAVPFADGVATIDRAVAPVGQQRTLDFVPRSATNYLWSIIRRPLDSTAQLSATDIANPTFTPDANDTYVFQLRTDYDLGYALTSTALTTLDVNLIAPPNVSEIAISRNPVRTGANVSFSVGAFSNIGIPLNYTWTFAFNGGAQDGPTLTGRKVTRTFSQEGSYTVNVVVTDGFFQIAQFADFAVTLQPNASAGGTSSVAANMIPVNPDEGVGVGVPDSLGGVVDLDVIKNGDDPNNPAQKEAFNVNVNTKTMTATNLASKFTQAGIYIVEAQSVSGQSTRKARLMLPVGASETGEDTRGVVDNRINRGTAKMTVKGRVGLSGTGADSLAVSVQIELPAGLPISTPLPLAIGLSNIFDVGSVDSKGVVTGLTGTYFTGVKIKYPRIASGTLATKGGEKATIAFTMNGAGLSKAGLDTEGITSRGKQKVDLPRKLQFAAVLSGVSYFDLLPVQYKIATDANGSFGTFHGRR